MGMSGDYAAAMLAGLDDGADQNGNFLAAGLQKINLSLFSQIMDA